MAVIERITMNYNGDSSARTSEATDSSPSIYGDELGLPGLRIGIRSTTASHSDYADLNLEEVLTTPLDRIITDGICS